MPIAFVGMPGGGKSTVGRQVAKRLHWAFQDSDALIEQRVGCTVKDFFHQHGEPAFRRIEEEVIAELCTGAKRAVIATGGGAVLSAANRAALRNNATVVYLRSTPEELFRRLRHDTQRPLLQTKDPLGRLRELYQQRDPLYREVAHFQVDTGRPSVQTLVHLVLMQLELAGAL